MNSPPNPINRLIKTFSDGSRLEYDRGSFDEWCIYLTRPHRKRVAPKDIQYFKRFQQLALKHTATRIYADFIKIYEQTTARLDQKILRAITRLSSEYGADALVMELLFTIVYAGMVAEENKSKAILKKRIKRLGMHQVLIEQATPTFAANFSKGQPWQVLDRECRKRGF